MGVEDAGRSTAIMETPSFVVAGLAFVLGLTTGLFLPSVFRQLLGDSRRTVQGGVPYRTIVYDENLPASLSRREPALDSQQPRYGGTGSLGVSPRAVDPALGHSERTDSSPH
jgi:hypothetical protein